MGLFRRKLVFVQAVQWTADDKAWEAVCALHTDGELPAFREDDGTVSIETEGGRLAVRSGDWIIKDEAGLLCQPSVFSTSYEPA